MRVMNLLRDGPRAAASTQQALGLYAAAAPGDRWHGCWTDTENHHGCGVHDGDNYPGERDGRIGEVSPNVGKAPGRPVVYISTTGLARSVWEASATGATHGSPRSRRRHQP